jgi:hypothetical protein
MAEKQALMQFSDLCGWEFAVSVIVAVTKEMERLIIERFVVTSCTPRCTRLPRINNAVEWSDCLYFDSGWFGEFSGGMISFEDKQRRTDGEIEVFLASQVSQHVAKIYFYS